MRITAILSCAAVVFGTVLAAGPASAQTSTDCSKRQPPFPGYDSAQIMRQVQTTVGTVPIRRGFYCVPDSAVGNEAQESLSAFGFGYDKARHRHKITSLNAIDFVLKSPVTSRSAEGYNFVAYARELVCQRDGRECKATKQQKVIGASSNKNADTYYEMPAGNPVGLLTVYCDYEDKFKLRCEDWVNKGLRPSTR
ncbi:hypothetical protein [Nocardia brasiliensis]|uniref:hypothetical protein n=1 Tax=Nocardia brasiliensis TaxID=37326 RepID=UPI003670F3E6